MMSHSIFLFIFLQLRRGRFPSEQLHPVYLLSLLPWLPYFFYVLSHNPLHLILFPVSLFSKQVTSVHFREAEPPRYPL